MKNKVLKVLNDYAKKRKFNLKITNYYASILCPFHSEDTPSCYVVVDKNSKGVPIGAFHCFGCGAKGSFKKLLKKLGYNVEIDEKENNKVEELLDRNFIVSLIDKIDYTEDFDFDVECKEAYKYWKISEPISENHLLKWRNISIHTLKSIKARIYFDEKFGENKLLFPWFVDNSLIGATRVLFNPTKSLKKYRYLDVKGSIKKKCLFPYDTVYKMFEENRYKGVVLVEGPRDALYLIDKGIPALAILGVRNWFKERKDYKLNLLETMALEFDFNNVYLMLDNDKEGRNAVKEIKESILEYSILNPKVVKYKEKDPAEIPEHKLYKFYNKILIE